MYVDDFASIQEIYDEFDGDVTENQIRYIVGAFTKARDEKKKNIVETLAKRAVGITDILALPAKLRP